MPLVSIEKLELPTSETPIPRLRYDPYLVSEYAAAMRLYGGWGDFPAIITDQNYFVLSGVHRVLAALEADVAKAKTTIRACENDAQRLLIATADNALHGKRWTSKEVTNITLLAERIGVAKEDLAQSLRVTVSKIERIKVTTVIRNGYEERVYAKKAPRPWVTGRVLDEEEVALMNGLRTPHPADLVLADFVSLGKLDALPVLDVESYRTAVDARKLIDKWIERDQHLLDAA